MYFYTEKLFLLLKNSTPEDDLRYSLQSVNISTLTCTFISPLIPCIVS